MTGCLLILVVVVAKAGGTTVLDGSPLLRWRSVAGVFYVGHMLLAYASWIVVRVALRSVGRLPPWLGWIVIGSGVVFLAGFVVLRGGFFAPPFWAHVLPALVGGALVLQLPT